MRYSIMRGINYVKNNDDMFMFYVNGMWFTTEA